MEGNPKPDVVMTDDDPFTISEDFLRDNAHLFTKEQAEAFKQELVELQKQQEEDKKYDPFDQFKFKYNNVPDRKNIYLNLF
jgi:hypothetical protein